MTTKIKNLDQLRDSVLEVFEKLCAGKIDIEEAGIVAKLSETVISGLKTQMEYSRLTNTIPSIPFLGDTSKLAKVQSQKLLPKNK